MQGRCCRRLHSGTRQVEAEEGMLCGRGPSCDKDDSYWFGVFRRRKFGGNAQAIMGRHWPRSHSLLSPPSLTLLLAPVTPGRLCAPAPQVRRQHPGDHGTPLAMTTQHTLPSLDHTASCSCHSPQTMCSSTASLAATPRRSRDAAGCTTPRSCGTTSHRPCDC